MLVFLIGFMGCGKSYTARNLSVMLEMPHIDMDKAIEEAEGMTIKEIFAEKGEPYFREAERKFLQNMDADANLIIATGGGAACFFDNIKTMNEKGLTIYLNRSKSIAMAQLLKGIEKRPLLQGMTEEQIADFYDTKLAERSPFYEQAKYHAGDADVEEIADYIKSLKQ